MALEIKSKALDLALSQIEKQFGKGSIMKLGEQAIAPTSRSFRPARSASTSRSASAVCRAAAWSRSTAPSRRARPRSRSNVSPRRRRTAASCAFIDAEHALDAGYARKLGVKVEDLLISQPDNGEQALEIAETLVQSGAIDVLVIDSVAALVPRAEIEGEMGEPQMGLQARLMSQALRKLTSIISRSRTIVIFINQIRMKIGVMFGNPETTTGGNALKFYSSVRIDIRRIGTIKTAHRGHRLAHQGQSRQEQGRAAVPRGRVRHPLWHRHFEGRRAGRYGVRAQHHREAGRLVFVRRRAYRAGPRERARPAEGESSISR